MNGEDVCQFCSGSGFVVELRSDLMGHLPARLCQHCRGVGYAPYCEPDVIVDVGGPRLNPDRPAEE